VIAWFQGDLRGEDSAKAADADNVASCHGADCWACCVVQTPTQESWAARESASCREEHSHVLDVRVIGCSQDCETNNTKDREGRKVNSTQSRPITGECDGDRKDASDAVRRNTVQLRHGGCVSHILEQSWQEERERLHCHVDSEEAECTNSAVDVEDGALDVRERDLLVDVRAVLAVQALSSDLLLCCYLGQQCVLAAKLERH
jgi:hypothetical protein